jgi:DNA-binding NarL/FixJ family response regulator
MASIDKAGVMHVAVVDDDEDTRLCFQDILRSNQNFSLSGSYSNAAEALAGLPRSQPDLALMDIQLPDLNGIECTKRLRHTIPRLKIIMVTGTHETRWVSDALQAGAAAYLVKPVDSDQLVATLRFAAAQATTGTPRMNLSLSPRETEVIAGLAEGLLYKEISQKLCISYAAVHKHQHNIFKKLHVTNRSEAIRIWLSHHNS